MGYLLAGLMDLGQKEFQLESAIGKIFSSEAAWNVVDESIQIHGGMGFMRELGLERVLRDLRIFRIFEGANDVLRLFVALTGCQYAGNNLKDVMKSSPLSLFTSKTKLLFGIYDNNLSKVIVPELKASADKLNMTMQTFSSVVEQLLFRYKKDIVHQQMVLYKIANSAIDIFSSLAVLSRACASIEQNLPSKEYETMMAKLVVFESVNRANVNLHIAGNKNAKEEYMLGAMEDISKYLVKSQGVPQPNPTGIL